MCRGMIDVLVLNERINPSTIIRMQMWVRKSTAIRIRRRLSGNFGQRKWFRQTKRKNGFKLSDQFS